MNRQPDRKEKEKETMTRSHLICWRR